MLTELVRRYRKYNPETGEFDQERTIREYARELGLTHPTLVMIFNGSRNPGVEVLRALVQRFPAAEAEVGPAIAADPEATPDAAPAEVGR